MAQDIFQTTFEAGFAPDADPITPGVLTGCHQFYPTARGMRTLGGIYPTQDSVQNPVFTSEQIVGERQFPRSGTSFGHVDIYAGTPSKVYRGSSSVVGMTDASRGGGYSNVQAWDFVRFGDYVVGAAGGDNANGQYVGRNKLQAGSVGSGSLSDITASVTCAVVTTAERFVLAFSGRDDYPDSWNCSARDDHTSWTVSAATLATTGRLVDPPGAILAARPIGNDVVAFKRNAMIRGRFVPGDSEVWRWEVLPFRAGASGPRAVCNLPDGRQAFLNDDSCYLYDGARVQDLLAGVAQEWYQSIQKDASAYSRYAALYDPALQVVWFGFPEYNVAALRWLAWHIPTGKFGAGSLPADIAILTYDYSSYSQQCLGYYDPVERRRWAFTRNQRTSVPGTSRSGWSTLAAPSITTGDFGDPYDLIELNGLRPDSPWRQAGTVAVTVETRDNRWSTSPRTVTGTNSDGTYSRFDARSNGHWHRAIISPSIAAEYVGCAWDTPGFAGRRK